MSHSDLQLYHGSFLRAPQCCSLGLVVWTQQERSRRSIIANETMQLNAEGRARLAKADMQTLNLKLWDAVEAGEVASANEAFLMGACADGFRECKMNPLVSRAFQIAAVAQFSSGRSLLFICVPHADMSTYVHFSLQAARMWRRWTTFACRPSCMRFRFARIPSLEKLF